MPPTTHSALGTQRPVTNPDKAIQSTHRFAATLLSQPVRPNLHLLDPRLHTNRTTFREAKGNRRTLLALINEWRHANPCVHGVLETLAYQQTLPILDHITCLTPFVATGAPVRRAPSAAAHKGTLPQFGAPTTPVAVMNWSSLHRHSGGVVEALRSFQVSPRQHIPDKPTWEQWLSDEVTKLVHLLLFSSVRELYTPRDPHVRNASCGWVLVNSAVASTIADRDGPNAPGDLAVAPTTVSASPPLLRFDVAQRFRVAGREGPLALSDSIAANDGSSAPSDQRVAKNRKWFYPSLEGAMK